MSDPSSLTPGPLAISEVQTLTGHTDRVWSVAWSPTGNSLASCGGDKTVRIWAKDGGFASEAKWICKAILEDNHNKTIRTCDWSPCGKYLATASFDMTVGIWEKVGDVFEFVASLEGHESEVKCARWSPSGTLLASCGRDKMVWVWEAVPPGNEFECVAVLSGHSQDVKSCVWHPSGAFLVSTSYDDSIKVWGEDADGDDWQAVQTLGPPMGHSSTVWAAAFNRTGDRMVSCSGDLTLRVWDTSGQPGSSSSSSGETSQSSRWKHLCTISGYHERTIYTVDWSSCNDLIVTGDGSDCLRIFASAEPERESGCEGPSFVQLIAKEKAHATDINCVKWHPKDPRLMASACDDGSLKIWKLTGDLECGRQESGHAAMELGEGG
eukprot:TRINITY_DN5118_c0_g1_i1.p1 TRINITY_DN5118_c0_g1~~TRINITY_DN5118_c0_g1_i1.p1  ORF type:complete len:380 (-),score=42.14 TRINITY_DN5118_c0_g1_i1:558-1697(-)